MMSSGLAARFWSKVDRSNGCWEWTAATYESGYGMFNVLGTTVMAHRMAYELERGSIGDSQVLHDCANRSCVKPSHLRLGSGKENMRDVWDPSVEATLELLEEPRPARELAEELDITRQSAYNRLEALEADGLVKQKGRASYNAACWVAVDPVPPIPPSERILHAQRPKNDDNKTGDFEGLNFWASSGGE